MNGTRRRKLAWLLAAVFATAMLMGTGPGVLLVNQPATFLGLPRIYVWGVFWYGVQLTTIVVAYFALWLPHDEPGSGS